MIENIAIVIPALNEEDALRHLLPEIPQMYAQWVVVVDNGSTDETGKLMLELFGSDPDCVLLRQPRNLGLAAAAYNAGRSCPWGWCSRSKSPAKRART